MQFVPVIRYCGGKRKQSEDIIRRMPHSIKTVYIPFLGGGSVMFQLLNSNIKYEKVIVSDIYKPLMGIWNLIKNDPESLLKDYEERYDMTLELGEEYYNSVVDKFNEDPDSDEAPYMFHYLMRACVRGSLEYDRYGNFISRYQKSSDRDRIINVAQLRPIVMRWNECMQDVELRCEPYDAIAGEVQEGDYCFFDPPYIDGTWYHDHDMDYDKFYDFLRNLPCDYSITLNGDRDIYPIPKDCYTDHEYIYYGVKKTASGRPTGSRDSFWMKHTDKYDYSEDINNVRQNTRGSGGSIPQVNDIKMMGDIDNRLTKLEDTMSQILNILTNK